MANSDQEFNEPTEQLDTDDLPQEVTESYGTGVKELPGFNVGGRSMRDDMSQYNAADPGLSGGDVDAAWSQHMSGEEEVGGTVATPDQDVVEELAAAVGLEMDDHAFLRTNEILEQRDDRRWDLDPKSSEDYEERRE